jgi:hypothetical protein
MPQKAYSCEGADQKKKGGVNFITIHSPLFSEMKLSPGHSCWSYLLNLLLVLRVDGRLHHEHGHERALLQSLLSLQLPSLKNAVFYLITGD